MSYSNLTLYSAAIPRYTGKKKEEGKKDDEDKYAGTIYSKDVIKVDDPANREKVRKFFESLKD